MLGNADMLINGAVELAIVGEPESTRFRAAGERAAASEYVPSLVMAGGAPRSDGAIALLTGRDARGGDATAYVCRRLHVRRAGDDADDVDVAASERRARYGPMTLSSVIGKSRTRTAVASYTALAIAAATAPMSA